MYQPKFSTQWTVFPSTRDHEHKWDAMRGKETPDTKPGNYYVSARRDDGRYALLVGPFRDDHAKALSLVDKATDAAWNSGDPRAPWYFYGTCRTEYDCDKPGILNDKVLI
jgi:hypothetical protein